jgi:hypothetical protein
MFWKIAIGFDGSVTQLRAMLIKFEVRKRVGDGGASIPEFRSAANAIGAGLLFAPSGVALGMALYASRLSDSSVVLEPGGCYGQSSWSNQTKRVPEAEGTPNELMPRAALAVRDQLVARLETLHTSIPNAGEPIPNAPFNHSQSSPASEPPIDRRCARAAEHPSAALTNIRG